MAEIISIIPARGGSKGVPGKNIKPLAGRALISHTIGQSLGSRLINRTIVSTDSDEIRDISLEYKAEVIMRPRALATDTSPSESALLHVLEYLKSNENYTPDIAVFLQCTSPLRREKDIDNQIEYLLKGEYDSVFSAFENKFFLWQVKNNVPCSVNYNYNKRIRRQEREKEFIENGSVYVFRIPPFLQAKNRICGKIGIYEHLYEYSFEIDTEFEFWLCEQIMKSKRYYNSK